MSPSSSGGGPAVAFVHPGDLDTLSGGYAYARRVLAGLSELSFAIRPLRLDGGFPEPTPQEADAAIAALAATAPDTILLVDGLAFGALPATGLRTLGRPIVALVHHPLALETGLAPAAAERLRASETEALAAADAVVVSSPETRRVLISHYAVPVGKITLAVPGTAPAARARANGAPPRLLAVGTLTPRKGYGVLLDALDRLRDLAWIQTIAGSPALDPATAADIARRAAAFGGRVRLAGPLDPAALDDAYGEADVLVHPAFYEGYGMALAEGLKRGLPIICTTGGAAAETVPDGAGLKVAPGDASALATALRVLLTDPARRRALADAAFAAGAALPDWPETTAAIGRTLIDVARR